MEKDATKILNRAGFSGPGVEKCVQEWCRKQSVNFGIVSYYKAYYNSFNS